MRPQVGRVFLSFLFFGLASAASAWADQAGFSVEVRRVALDAGGRFLVELDVRNQSQRKSILEVRAAANERLPLAALKGKPEAAGWSAHAQGGEIRIAAGERKHALSSGGSLGARLLFHERRGPDSVSIFQAREMRGQTLLSVVVRFDDGTEERQGLPVPFIPRLSPSLEKEL